MNFHTTKNQSNSSDSINFTSKYSSFTPASNKDALIEALETKNKRIKTQLYKVDEFFNDIHKVKRKNFSTFSSVLRESSSIQVEKKELENAYQKIYMMEKQIKKFQQLSENINATKKIERIYSQLRQQELMMVRLKKQQKDLKKVIQKHTKELNDLKKQTMGNKVKQLLGQIEYLQQKVKESTQAQKNHEKAMEKQKIFIRTLQNQIIETGVSRQYIRQIRKKIIIPRIMKTEESTPSHTSLKKKSKTIKTQEQYIEEDIRTRKKYQKMMNEISILEKVSLDEEKTILTERIAYRKAKNKNIELLKGIEQTQNEIADLQDKINTIRSKISFNDLKPKQSGKSRPRRLSEKRKKTIHKINPKSLNILQQYSMLPNIKYDMVGKSTRNGQKFTDRVVLGHESTITKMKGILVYVNSIENRIFGIKIAYANMDGQLHITDDSLNDESMTQKFKCIDNEYIKGISGSMNAKQQLQSLTVLTTNSRYCRFGRSQKSSHNFVLEINEDEHPVCLFGSIREQNFIESIGVEIMRDDDFYGLVRSERSLGSNEFFQP